MGYIKTKGIVVREVDTGEADKVVTIFTKSHGKISCFVKNARRSGSRFAAGTQFLAYCEFVLFEKNEKYSINSCDVIEVFYHIRNDIFRLTYSVHISEIINDTVQENEPAVRVLQLFLNSLYYISQQDRSPELIVRIFEIRILAILGYAPYVAGCMSCGQTLLDTGVRFSYNSCGFLCKDCIAHDASSAKISLSAAKAINHIVTSNIKELFKFELLPNILDELGQISGRYLNERLEKNYKKLDFLKNLINI